MFFEFIQHVNAQLLLQPTVQIQADPGEGKALYRHHCCWLPRFGSHQLAVCHFHYLSVGCAAV